MLIVLELSMVLVTLTVLELSMAVMLPPATLPVTLRVWPPKVLVVFALLLLKVKLLKDFPGIPLDWAGVTPGMCDRLIFGRLPTPGTPPQVRFETVPAALAGRP